MRVGWAGLLFTPFGQPRWRLLPIRTDARDEKQNRLFKHLDGCESIGSPFGLDYTIGEKTKIPLYLFQTVMQGQAQRYTPIFNPSIKD